MEFSYRVWGDRALFTDPSSLLSLEKLSYMVPTYSALVGLTESIYWKPGITYEIISVRVMNKIEMFSEGVRYMVLRKGVDEADRGMVTYLDKVAYQVKVRMVVEDKKVVNKHRAIFERSLNRGGRLEPFLGTSECGAYIEPCDFGEGEGFYDSYGLMAFGNMFCRYDYNNAKRVKVKNKSGKVTANEYLVGLDYYNYMMDNGVIDFEPSRFTRIDTVRQRMSWKEE